MMIDKLPDIGLTVEDGMRQVWFVEANGKITGGAEAANQILRYVWWAWPVSYLYYVPGIRQLEDRLYHWVAANRTRLPGGTPACEIPQQK